MASPAATSFSVTYDAAQQLLVGRWRAAGGDEELYPSYEQLLAAARAHGNCRFWLLDMQQRPWHSVSFAKWYTEFLANRVVRELGSPVFVAYVAAELHRQEIDNVSTQALLRHTAQVEFYPYFFNDEWSAREWLAYYQAHPQQSPTAAQ